MGMHPVVRISVPAKLLIADWKNGNQVRLVPPACIGWIGGAMRREGFDERIKILDFGSPYFHELCGSRRLDDAHGEAGAGGLGAAARRSAGSAAARKDA
ncbi:hypothetical protein RQX22_01590 [Sphingosinicella sp. GR2756]|uniref:Uncharacterized protein n=1 Tax=Sphingosinicella rhizophila TaxID=3050082 RepID=A0ABU3Q3X7_9SPHN|nr:hypothetical protein [Sphingosinicella sp. GR2756]